ncbi:MAG: LamG domain-containing protein [Pirellulales bacterium]|nr:LamG domain-containing protein [Pirellulales bacterium]
MSETDPYRSELASLIDALFEGNLSAEETKRVARTVTDDPEAAELYWDFVELHAELRRVHRGTSTWTPEKTIGAPIVDLSAPDVPLADLSDLPPPPATGGGMPGSLGMLGIVLGAVLCLGGVVALVGGLGSSNDRGAGTRAAPIARVTSMADCTWVDPHEKDRCAPGLPLAAGECIQIQSGSIQITYENGVVVTLTGPATYRVIDEKFGYLQDGFALARVPERAIGFTINTPAGKIIDCGTEFGVTVGRDKQTGVVTADMRVIDGAVDVNVNSSSGKGAGRKRFKKGEAVRISSLNNGSGRPESGDAFDPRTIPGLRLWLNADAGVLRGPDDRVTEMIDLIGDSNNNAENARQPEAERRPRWLSGTINNRPTLVFEGKQYIQLPNQSDLNFQDESLSIFVVGNTSGGTQYFLSSRADGTNHDPRGFRFTSSRDGGLRYQAAGVTVSRPCDTRKHAVFSVIHDRRTPGANTVTLYRNGGQLGPVVKVDDSDISNAFPLTIGANLEAIHKYPKSPQNYLQGDLGEILIYDRVLSPRQRGKVETYLVRKYGFAFDTNEAAGQTSNPSEREPVIQKAP